MQCNQICPWNYYDKGCLKPSEEICPLSNVGLQQKEHTNTDKLRVMGVEELATFLVNKPLCPKPTDKCPFDCKKMLA